MAGERSPGPLGESTLSKWAHEEGAVINKANDDRSGWDFILEFPSKRSRGTTDEERNESQYQCLIQVKSTDVGQEYCQIKLNNMKRLVESPLPAFVLLLSFGGTRSCRDAHLVHIGEEYITRTLKRVRTLVVQGEGDKIHKRSMNVRWTADDRLSALNGAALLERICSVIGISLSRYSNRKMNTLQTVGYGSGTAKATVKILVPDTYRQLHPEELLVDAKLGLTGQLDLVGGEVRTLRFGIPGKKLAELERGARLSIGPATPSAEGEFVLRTQDLERVARVHSTVRGARSDADLEHGGIAKVRFDLPFSYFTISLPVGIGTFHFQLPREDERMSLEEAVGLSSVFSLLEHASQVRDVVSMEFEGNHIGAMGPQDLESIKPFLAWAKLVDDGHGALQALGIQPSVNVTLKELAVQKDALQIIRASQSGQIPRRTVFTFMLNEGVPPEPGEEMCFPISFDMTLGEVSVTVFLAMIGNVSEDRSVNGEYVVPVKRIEVERVIQLDGRLTLPRSRQEYLREIAQSRSNDMGVLCWWEERSDWQESDASD